MPDQDIDEKRLQLDRDRLNFDNERWQAEERRKQAELDGSKWSNPLVIAIMSASLAGLVNIVGASWNGHLQRISDEGKAEADLVLQMIKTDVETAKENLRFLVESGLLTDKAKREAILQYVKNSSPGRGPALPIPVGTTGRGKVTSGCESTAPTRGLEGAKPVNEFATEWQKFTQPEIDAGNDLRLWRRAGDHWEESSPSDRMTHCIVERVVLDGCIGDRTVKQDDNKLEMFIPDVGCMGMVMKYRFNKNAWLPFGIMANYK